MTIPDGVSSPRAKLVYLYLQVTGGGRLSDLQETLRMDAITLLPILRALADEGVVERENGVIEVRPAP